MDDVAIRQSADDKFKRLAVDFGFTCSLLFECGQGKFTVAAAYMWVMPAILHRQIHIIYTDDGRPMGYMTWAFVSDKTLARLQADSVQVLDASEWNEGLNLWIVDVVCRKGMARHVVRAVRGRLGATFTEAFGLKRKPDGSLKRLVNIRARSGEMLNA